jgi:hypothetical protein
VLLLQLPLKQLSQQRLLVPLLVLVLLLLQPLLWVLVLLQPL